MWLGQRLVAGSTDKTTMLRKDVLEKQGQACNYCVGRNKIKVQNSGPVLENMPIRFLL